MPGRIYIDVNIKRQLNYALTNNYEIISKSKVKQVFICSELNETIVLENIKATHLDFNVQINKLIILTKLIT